jgi:hypothetical protein
MSWKFGAIYLQKNYSGDLSECLKKLDISCAPTQTQITLRETTTSNFYNTAVGFHHQCTLIHDNQLPYDACFEDDSLYELDEILAALSAETPVLCFFLDGITNTSGLAVFRDGQRVRQRGIISGEIRVDAGVPLPEEQAFLPDNNQDEERIFAIIKGFTGTDFTALLDEPLRLLDCE